MIASSSRLFACCLLLGPLGALAQVGPPQRLIPVAPPSEVAPPPAAPTGTTAASPATPRGEALPRGETVPRPLAVRVDPLQAPDPSGVGLLDLGKGGLAPDLW